MKVLRRGWKDKANKQYVSTQKQHVSINIKVDFKSRTVQKIKRDVSQKQKENTQIYT